MNNDPAGRGQPAPARSSSPCRRLGTLGGLLLGGGAALFGLTRGRKLRAVAPALRGIGLALMPPLFPAAMPLVRWLTDRTMSDLKPPPGVRVTEHEVAGLPGAPEVRVQVLQRAGHVGTSPALLWLHGGGYLFGTPSMDFILLARILETLDVTIVTVDYRLAPVDPFPAALDDAAAVLGWMVERSEALGLQPGRIAVGGNSAGGGLAAALAQRAHDEGIALAAQLLMYPMLDDRTVLRDDHGERGRLMWTPTSNRYGWTAYLGHAPGAATPPPYAVPARREDLSGLAPAWIGVGTLDLFMPEDAAYAERLRQAGVECRLDLVSDAPHGFDLLSFGTPIARTFHRNMIAMLADAFAAPADGAERQD